MSGNPSVTTTVVTTNETGARITDVEVTLGGEIIDNLPSLGKGESSLPNQYSGPSGNLPWTVAFTDHAGHRKTGSATGHVATNDTKAKVALNSGSFTVTTASGHVTKNYD